MEVLSLHLEEHKSEPLRHSGSRIPGFVSSIQHGAWLYLCTAVECWLLKWKTQQRRGEDKTDELKGHHHIALGFKGLIKIKYMLQFYKYSLCEFTLHRHRSTNVLINIL